MEQVEESVNTSQAYFSTKEQQLGEKKTKQKIIFLSLFFKKGTIQPTIGWEKNEFEKSFNFSGSVVS